MRREPGVCGAGEWRGAVVGGWVCMAACPTGWLPGQWQVDLGWAAPWSSLVSPAGHPLTWRHRIHPPICAAPAGGRWAVGRDGGAALGRLPGLAVG